MRYRITASCAICNRTVRYASRREARRNGWSGLGWERSTVYRAYWGECPECAEKRQRAASSEASGAGAASGS